MHIFGQGGDAKKQGQASAGSAQGLISDGTDQTFRQDVLEPSRETPVIVDFWAPWCGPCRDLGPKIEAAVIKAKGAVKLVKINIDQNPGVAGQLGVQSIPAVFAFDKGRPVDGFMGNVPVSEIDAFVKRLTSGEGHGHGAHEVDGLVARGLEQLEAGDIGGAAQDFAHALNHAPEHPGAIAGLARAYLMNGDPERAKDVLEMAPPEAMDDPAIVGVRTALGFAEKAADAGPTAELARALEANPADHATRFKLAQARAAQGDLQGAADELLTIIAADRAWNEDAARKELLQVIEAAGPMSDVAKDGRRRLSAILFS